ncbi:MAG: hypothetical protein J5616_01055, partial [Bacteroidaceae bacterium]|nr:hypothetical protein [Bacteroidaceae bacterium]
DVKANLIKSRRIVFTPSVDLKNELANTSVQITCYDRDGNLVKRVTSSDDGTVEDEENGGSTNEGGTENGGTTNEGGTNSGSGTGTITPGGDNGGDNGGDPDAGDFGG